MTNPQDGTTLYVLVPPSPLFAAHWSLFLPDRQDGGPSQVKQESPIGRRIHVAGDRLHGFLLEIIREYDVSKHGSAQGRKFAIGRVPGTFLQGTEEGSNTLSSDRRKDEDEGGGYIDNEPCDEIERVCVSIGAPGPSLNSVASNATLANGKKSRTEVRDCQWWIRQVVNKLAEDGMLEHSPLTDRTPLDALNAVPMH